MTREAQNFCHGFPGVGKDYRSEYDTTVARVKLNKRCGTALSYNLKYFSLSSQQIPNQQNYQQGSHANQRAHAYAFHSGHFGNSVCLLRCVGGVSCPEFCRRASKRRGKSNEQSCRAMHICAVQLSGGSAKRFGPSKRLKNSRLGSAAVSAQRRMRLPASARRPPIQSWQSSRKSCPRAIDRLAG